MFSSLPTFLYFRERIQSTSRPLPHLRTPPIKSNKSSLVQCVLVNIWYFKSNSWYLVPCLWERNRYITHGRERVEWTPWSNQCLGFFHMSYYWLLFNHFVCLLWHSVLSNLKLKFQICGLQPRSGESVLCTGAPGLPRKKWCMVRISENNYALIKKFSIHRPFAPLREKLSVLTKVAQGCHICQGRPY